MKRLIFLWCNEKIGQFGPQARPKVVQQRKASAEDARRNHDIGIDRPIRNSEAASESLAPVLGLAARIFVADEERSLHLLKKCLQRSFKRPSNHESQAPLSRILSCVPQSLLQKMVMAKRGAGIVGNEPEENDDGKIENIGRLNRYIERRVVLNSNSALHPVNYRARTSARSVGAAH